MKRQVKFWTTEEIDVAKIALAKFKKTDRSATWLSRQLGRTKNCSYQKLLEIKKGIQRRPLEKNITKTVQQPITKPAPIHTSKAIKEGFVINFTPKKTEVFQDHVRLYF
jgi:hypothetical protein